MCVANICQTVGPLRKQAVANREGVMGDLSRQGIVQTIMGYLR
jgi:hypothetical protein